MSVRERVGNEFKVSLHFVWFDLWIGFYYNTEKRILYFCPLPCIVIKIQLGGL